MRFPTIEELAAMSYEELQALLAEYNAYFAENADAARTNPDLATELAEVVDAAEYVAAECTRREEQAQELAGSVDEMAQRLAGLAAGGGDDAEPGTTGDPDAQPGVEPGTNPDPEAGTNDQGEPSTQGEPQVSTAPTANPAPAPSGDNAASARRLPSPSQARAHVPAARQPATPKRKGGDFRMLRSVGDVADGRDVDRKGLAVALSEFSRNIGATRDGNQEFVPVARAEWGDSYPTEQRLRGDELSLDADGATVLAAVMESDPKDLVRGGQRTVTAAGGICAPTEGWYDNLVLADDGRPVRDSLPAFNARRGGIRLIPPPVIGDLTAGVTTVTNAQDAAESVTKACVSVACPAQREYIVQAINVCVKFSNFGARAYPEQVNAWMANAAAAHSRVAETALLDAIAANSKAVTTVGLVGGSREVIARGVQVAAAYRSRFRMRPDALIVAHFPAWLIDLAVADIVRSGVDDPMAAAQRMRASFEATLRNNNVEPNWYWDTKTGGGQIFAAEVAATAADNFPADVFTYFYAPGTFVFLDGGTLDFGLMRDSTLNAANRFTMATETFEQLAFVGVESLEVRMTLCPDGSSAALRAVTCPIVT